MDSLATTRVSAATAEVLSTPELLERIIRNGGLRPKDLVSCATVCWSWSEPSLDELWSSARFSNLLQVFPSVKKVGSKLQVEGFITRPDWDRFLHYSKRIGQLDAVGYSWGMPRISDRLLLEFAVSRPASPLFPRMKVLRWDAECCSDLGSWNSFCRGLLTDKLSEIRIFLPLSSARGDNMAVLLHAIPIYSPNISRLSIETQGCDYVYTQGARLRPSYFLPQLPNLSDLTLPSGMTGLDTLRAISRFPSLNVLTICFYLEKGMDFDAAIDSEIFFPSLTSITIHRGRSSDIERFLNRISNKRNLEALHAEFVDYTDPVVETFVRDTYDICPALKKLTIRRLREDRPSLESVSADSTGGLPSLSRSTLYHLRRYYDLESLTILHHLPSEVTDDDFMGLVEALPNLTRVEFRFLPLLTGIPCLTLKILHRLSNFYHLNPDFRGISYLRLHVNASDLPDRSVDDFLLSEEVYPLRQLDTLCLDASPISSVEDVALYLSRVIPSSCKWDVYTGKDYGYPPASEVASQVVAGKLKEMDSRRDKWREVRDLLRGCRRLQSFLSKLV